MVTYTWNPFRELDSLRHEVERAFEEFGSENWPWPRSKARFLPGRSARTYPLVNVSDDKEALYVEALAPGVNPESLDITVHRNALRIAGEKPALATDIKPEAFHRSERGAGKFVRIVELPAEVDRDRITADYKNGIVLIKLPKAEAAKPKQISVHVN
jgi:HSP20 family protein